MSSKGDKNEKTAPAAEEKPTAKPFKLNEDQQAFLELAKATGQKFDLETESGRHEFVTEANKWLIAGRPRPKFEKQAEQEKPIPMKLYRIKERGVQYIYGRTTKGDTFGKIREEKQIEHLSADKTSKYYRTETITKFPDDAKFDKARAQALAKEAQELCRNPTFYIQVGDYKYSVTPKDWAEGDFDALIELHRAGKYHI